MMNDDNKLGMYMYMLTFVQKIIKRSNKDNCEPHDRAHGFCSESGSDAAREIHVGITPDVIGGELRHLGRHVAPFLLAGANACAYTHCRHGGRLNYGPVERQVPNTPSGTCGAHHIATLLA